MAAVGQLESLVTRLEQVTSRLEKVSVKGGSGSTTVEDDPEFIDEFEKFLKETLANYVKLSSEIGGDVKTQSEIVQKAFQAQRQFLGVAAKFSQPSQNDLMVLLKPTSEIISEIQGYREKNRKSALFNHLSVVSEGIPAMGWVAISPKPGNYVKDMIESAQFYINRVIKDYKDKDPKHVEWARSFLKVLTELQNYVKEYHSIGVLWNKEGSAAKPDALKAGSSAAPPPPAGGPPPPPAAGPPPPPPPAAAPAPTEASSDTGDSRQELFAALNKGSDITKGLKKVTKDMQTHKNPALRAGSTVSPRTSAAVTAPKPFQAGKPVAKPVTVAKKPPVMELQNKKWIVEYQEDKKDLVISDTNINQTVYVYKCNKSVLQIKGKINSVIMDSCNKCGLVFDDLVSTCEFVNCKSVQAQANGVVPTVSIDKTDGCQVYLSKGAVNADIITAKSSEMNILIPNAEGEYSEYPVPEQFKTKWTGSGLKTETMDIAG